jgi:hypothetical protein
LPNCGIAELKKSTLKTPLRISLFSQLFNLAVRQFRSSAILFVVCCSASLCLARSWHITDFDDSVVVSKDGSAVVTEKIALRFVGQYSGIHRYIPISYSSGPQGTTNYTLFVGVLSVKDSDGNKLKYDKKTTQGNLELTIYIPGASDTTRRIEITYLVRNGTRFFGDYDEFYWNVTGTAWAVPIDRAAATVILPSDAAGLRAQAFTGAYGATTHEATATISGNRAEFATTSPLPMRAGLTVDVYIPKGILEEPSGWTRAGWFIRSNPVVLVPLLSLVVMFGLWFWRGRDPDPGMSVAPMYEPPAQMTPAEVGTLMADSFLPRDISATLVDLAVKGYIKIEDITTPGFLTKHHDYRFHLLKTDRAQWNELHPHERAVLSKIFGVSGEQVNLSDLKNDFYTVLPMLKQDVFYQLKARGMYRIDPDQSHVYTFGGIAVIAIVTFAAAHFAGVDLFASPALAIISFALSILIIFLFGRIMTARSLTGAQTWVQIKGFEDFMSRVELDRLRRMPPDTFEKFLPYAMALGIEAKWARAFASLGLDRPAPGWYVGPGWGPGAVWNPILFTNSLSTMSTTAMETFVSQPRSSATSSGWGGGGFGGGGFSGGGFGGGGGDAF